MTLTDLDIHYAAIRLAEDEFEAQTDLTKGMLPYLLALRHGPCYVGDLAQRVGVTQQATGKMLTLMEAHNLSRRIVDKADRRGKFASLTPTGLRLLESVNWKGATHAA
jgi:DNA-binding MarR family transcriptional regulator